MRFGATLSQTGIGWLEKRFLPAFEKLGSKELALLLTPTFIHLVSCFRTVWRSGFSKERTSDMPWREVARWESPALARGTALAWRERGAKADVLSQDDLSRLQVHDSKVAGGLELHADLDVNELFEPGTLNLVSNADNKVAVTIDPALLLRVLRGLDALEPDT